MLQYLKTRALSLALLAMVIFSIGELSAASTKSYVPKAQSTKSYSKKAPYAGYGKASKVNGLPKTRIVSGHMKKTSKGYSYVNPYARSK